MVTGTCCQPVPNGRDDAGRAIWWQFNRRLDQVVPARILAHRDRLKFS
jgi:hypothetical protein